MATKYRLYSLTLYSLAAVLVAAVSSGCGPTVKQAPELAASKLQTIAVLPTIVDSDIQRERADYIRKSLIRQLTTNGFVVLDDSLVSKVCADTECKNRGELKDKYGVDTFAELKIESQARVNFVAGYYNTISGTVRMLTTDSKELVSVAHQESERGGVLFNSGQIIQGVIQSFENSGDDSFYKLADRFTKTIALSLPSPAGGAALAKVTDVNITKTNITPLGDSRFQICIEGNPNAAAEFVVDRIRTPLRETKRGEYCGALLLGSLVQPGSKVAARLRSPFGVPAEQEIDSAPFLSCAPTTLVSRSVSGDNPRLTFGCSSSLSAADKEKCDSQLSACTSSQFLIYRSEGAFGPFQKVGQETGPAWVDKKVKTSAKPTYAVVAVSKNTGASVPVKLIQQP